MCPSYSILYQRIGLDTSYIENAVQTLPITVGKVVA
jgi:hypothetical protein